MRWEIERYVKLYRRDTAEWKLVPWQARGLFDEMLRKADRDGTIAYGRLSPAYAVAVLLNGKEEEIAPWLPYLLKDGCVTDDVTNHQLVIPNYRKAQDEPMTGAERTARWRKHKKARDASDVCDESDAPAEPAEPTEPSDPSQQQQPAAPASPAPPPALPVGAPEPGLPPSAGNSDAPPGSASSWPLLEQFRSGFADRMAITNAESIRLSRPEIAQQTRKALEAELRRRGVASVLDAVVPRAQRETRRTWWLSHLLTWIQDLPEGGQSPPRKQASAPAEKFAPGIHRVSIPGV